MQRNSLEVQAAVEVDRRDDVLKRRDDPLDGGDVLLLEGQWSRRGGGRTGSRCRRSGEGLGLGTVHKSL